jgi:hypothetical protein
MTDDFNDALRRGYAASRAKSARPLFHDQGNRTPEDVRTDAIMAGKSAEEADALARRQAARIGDGETFNVMLRNDLDDAKGVGAVRGRRLGRRLR